MTARRRLSGLLGIAAVAMTLAWSAVATPVTLVLGGGREGNLGNGRCAGLRRGDVLQERWIRDELRKKRRNVLQVNVGPLISPDATSALAKATLQALALFRYDAILSAPSDASALSPEGRAALGVSKSALVDSDFVPKVLRRGGTTVALVRFGEPAIGDAIDKARAALRRPASRSATWRVGFTFGSYESAVEWLEAMPELDVLVRASHDADEGPTFLPRPTGQLLVGLPRFAEKLVLVTLPARPSGAPAQCGMCVDGALDERRRATNDASNPLSRRLLDWTATLRKESGRKEIEVDFAIVTGNRSSDRNLIGAVNRYRQAGGAWND